MQDKKAISVIISYVLMIVITISLAVLVYSWLRFQAKQIEEIDKCPAGVSLIVQNYSCSVGKNINLGVKNKGLFNISGFYIRGTDKTGPDALPIIFLKDLSTSRLEDEDVHYFSKSGVYAPLPPGESEANVFSYFGLEELKKIQIEPFRIQNKKIVLCEEATISQDVDCGVEAEKSDAEIMDDLKQVIADHVTGFLNKDETDPNFDFNADDMTNAFDVGLLRNVHTASDEQFDIIYTKITSAFAERMGLVPGDEKYLEEFDFNNNDEIDTADQKRAQEALIGDVNRS